MSLRVVFLGNQQSVFSSRHFEALIKTDADLVGVVDAPPHKQSTSNPLPAGYKNFVQTARARGLPCVNPDAASDALADHLASLEPDLLLAVGYPLILKAPVLAVPRRLGVNFHASLLPHYRGKHPVFWALRAGERWSGLTVHAMNPGIDTGEVLYQVRVRTHRDDSVGALYERIMDRSQPLVSRLIADLQAGSLNPQPQPAGAGSYYSSIKEQDYFLDWHWPAEKLRRFVATTPGKCSAELGGRRVCFWDARTTVLPETRPPGTLVKVGRLWAVIAAGEGGFSSSRVRFGGESLPLAAFCRRLGLTPGDRVI